jgi:hypothetical protein
VEQGSHHHKSILISFERILVLHTHAEAVNQLYEHVFLGKFVKIVAIGKTEERIHGAEARVVRSS